eukprot:jgi/Botrbrau1/22565/Bobra.176_1s0001.1
MEPNNLPSSTNIAANGFSLTFTATKKKAVVLNGAATGVKEEVQKELILGLTDGKVNVAERNSLSNGNGKRIIPKIPNTFEIGRNFNPNRYIPEAVEAVDRTDKFELAGPEEAQKDVAYGLQRRERPEKAPGPSVTSREWEDQRFKEDVEALPDEATLESYEAMPIEAFGEAMMRGMGWSEGRPVGRNSKAKVPSQSPPPLPRLLYTGPCLLTVGLQLNYASRVTLQF